MPAPPTADELLSQARIAAERAHCPYSGFPVGAAAVAEDGRMFAGCNVENASYGLSICAERSALFQAAAAGARILRIAVSCSRGIKERPGTLMPCGACRQVMSELMPADAEVLVDGVGAFTVAELLPSAFHL